MNINDLKAKKARGEKIAVLTCYDFPSAEIIAKTPLDIVLVGDTLAMVVHGFKTTTMATVDMMVLHTEAVARGIGKQLIVTDLPFLCHRASMAETVHHVKRLIQAGAHAVKIEGGDTETCQTIHALTTAGVPIVGHIGLTPQSIHQLGSYKVQGKSSKEAERLMNEAQALEAAGCRALVLECIPGALATEITQTLSIPTIGIGAGVHTDGQVLVWHDIFGLNDFAGKFYTPYAHLKAPLHEAIHAYVSDVKAGHFPTDAHTF